MNLDDVMLVTFLGGSLGGIISSLLILMLRNTFSYFSELRQEKRFDEYKEFVEFQKKKQNGDLE